MNKVDASDIDQSLHLKGTDVISRLFSGIVRITSGPFTTEMELHGMAAQRDITIPSGITYTVVVGNSGLVEHAHKIICLNETARKSVEGKMKSSPEAREIIKHVKFMFTLGDTMMHVHGPKTIYICVDDYDTQTIPIAKNSPVSIYYIERDGDKDGVPVKTTRTVFDLLHTHTLNIIRHQIYVVSTKPEPAATEPAATSV